MSTFFSRPRAEVTSHHQHVDTGNECHKCTCFQTCNHDTRVDANHYMTMLFILSTIDKEFSTLVTGLAFGLFELFTSVCSSTFGTEEDTCSRWDLFSSPTPFHIVSRRPVACLCGKLQLSLFEQNSILQFSDQCKKCLSLSFCYEPLRKLLLGHSRSSSAILFGQRIFADAFPRRDNSELSCLEYKSQYPRHGQSKT